MDVVLCANDNYVSEALKCAEYIAKTQKDCNIHLLGDNISSKNVHKLESAGVYVTQFNDHTQLGEYWRPNFLKLYIPQYYPALDKVIYLDTDTITLRRMKTLWDLDISEYYAGCVQNIVTPYAKDSKHYVESGIDPHCPVANLGVMLMNCTKWRADNITKRLIDYTLEILNKLTDMYNPNLALARIQKEEFCFNCILRDKWLQLPEKWNVVPVSNIKTPYIIHTWHDPGSVYK